MRWRVPVQLRGLSLSSASRARCGIVNRLGRVSVITLFDGERELLECRDDIGVLLRFYRFSFRYYLNTLETTCVLFLSKFVKNNIREFMHDCNT